MVFSLMMPRVGIQQRNIDDVEELRRRIVLIPVLRKRHFSRWPRAHRANPSTIAAGNNLAASKAAAVRRLVGVCQADDAFDVSHLSPLLCATLAIRFPVGCTAPAAGSHFDHCAEGAVQML